MRKNFAQRYHLATVAIIYDLLTSIITAYVANSLVFDKTVVSTEFLWLVGVGVLFQLALSVFFGVYGSWRGKQFLQFLSRLVIVWIVLFIALSELQILTWSPKDSSRLFLLYWLPLSFLVVVSVRVIGFFILSYYRKKGKNIQHLVLIGSAQAISEVAEAIKNKPEHGFNVAYAYALPKDDVLLAGELENIAKRIGEIDECSEIWICLPLSKADFVKEILYALRHVAANIRYIPDWSGVQLLNHNISRISNFYMFDLSCSPAATRDFHLKEIEDKVLSLLILLLITPIAVMIALGVKLTSPGPVFYKQKRVGWNGRSFTMYKFRTMPVGVETVSGPAWSAPNDGRATKFGAFLRKTSLDELPQFFNVLRGDMSIVGPRPERPVFVDEFKDTIPNYMKKHLVKAGLTGWAQVNGWRGNTCLQTRIEYDLYYIENWSLLFDLKIIFLTLFRGFVNKNAY